MSKTGANCAVHGCKNSYGLLNMWLDRECVDHLPLTKRNCGCPPHFALHKKPNDDYESRMWLKNLNLKKPPKTVFVCSFHFVDKKPTTEHPSPELFLGYERKQTKSRRQLKRVICQTDQSEETSSCEPSSPSPSSSSPVSCTEPDQPTLYSDSTPSGEPAPQHDQTVCQCATKPTYRDAATQWEDHSLHDHGYSSPTTKTANKAIQCNAGTEADIASTILVRDKDSLLFTGIHLAQFYLMVQVLAPFRKKSFTLPVVDQILMAFMKLKLNSLLGDLAQRFKVSQSFASKIISYWIDCMATKVSELVSWLPRDTLKTNMPLQFNKNYPLTTCIIDCAETSLQRASNLDSRSATFSHYKGTNTIKYLVAVSPSGMIMFISHAYAGKSSDKYITMNCGFLDHLRPGDEVMADRGFTIQDLLRERLVRLNIPAFTHRRAQLTNEEVTRTRRVANVRIHVERAIRRLKVFKILSQTVPISLTHKVDKILIICAALVNLKGALIKS